MNLLDVIIVVLVAAQVVRWVRVGFLLGFFSLTGLLIGLALGLMLAPFIINRIEEPLLQIFAAIFVMTAGAVTIGFAGQYLGKQFSHLGVKLRLKTVDKVLGGLFGGVATLLLVWLVTSVFSGIPYQSANHQIRESYIVRGLNHLLPPAPAVLDRLADFINPSDFPRFFPGPEPRPLEPVDPPSSEEIANALEATRGSVVRIESTGCGGLLTGSGFVIGESLVVTNAHVVAGVVQPTIVDIEGYTKSDVILFDSDQDIAILRARSSLAGRPLQLQEESLSRGDTGTTLGYPGGDRLAGTAAAVLGRMQARGRNIYGQGNVTRDIYQLQTEVSEGNSGGPVVLEDGTVVAVIFGRSDAEDGIGYALTSTSVIPIVDDARDNREPVSTGRCIRR